MQGNFTINIFDSIRDNKVSPIDVTWGDVVDLFTTEATITDDKFKVRLFNFATYKRVDEIPDYTGHWEIDPITGEVSVLRRQDNIKDISVLVLDFDGGLTVDDAKDRFREYEYLCYSSYNHLADGKTNKFRVLLPLATPIPAWRTKGQYGVITDAGDWYKRLGAIKEFAGPCDPKSFDPNQIYALPSSSPKRTTSRFAHHNKGKHLDWLMFDESDAPDLRGSSKFKSSTDDSTQTHDYLPDDYLLRTKNGTILLRDVVGKINNVFCPSPEHNDKTPTEFARRVEETGNIFVYCSKCKKKFYMKREGVIAHNRKPHASWPEKIAKKKGLVSDLSLLLLDGDFDRVYTDAEDRKHVLAKLDKIKSQILRDMGIDYGGGNKSYKSHIVYMPEGSGKSRLVLELAKHGRKVVFACKSWDQAESKYAEYVEYGAEQGFGVRIVRSKDAKARRRFSTKLLREKALAPFKMGRVLDKESLDAFIKNNPDLSPEFIKLSWNFFSADRLTFESIPHPELNERGEVICDELQLPADMDDTRIIVTTFEQLRIHRLRNTIIPRDWIIRFDDPDIVDVIDIELYDTDKWVELSEEERKGELLEINGRQYYKRNPNQSLGYAVKNHKCIYTTTEIITRKGIERLLNRRKESYITHDDMDNLVGGKITILGTEFVRKKMDGVIPLVSRRLNKGNKKTTLIADGLASEFNHSNNKGRNDLKKTNLLVELSIPHPIHIRTICDALRLDFKTDRPEITRSIMLDRMHQAIGRNSGYRYQGFECVVLVDPSIHKSLITDTRYKIDSENSVLIDKTKAMSKKEKRTTKSASRYVDDIVSLLNNINDYIADNRKVRPDITHVVNQIDDDSQRLRYITRLLVAFGTLSGLTIEQVNSDSFSPTNHVEEAYRGISRFILDTMVPPEKIEFVLECVQKESMDPNPIMGI